MKPHQKLNQLLKPFKISIEEDEALVALDVEFGYKHFIWKPEMSCDELERWWRRQLHFGRSIGKFPGKLIDVDKIIYKPFGKHYNSLEEMVESFNDPINYCPFFERWFSLDNSSLCYHASIFSDDYSFLKTPSGRYIHHMGWWPAKIQTDLDVKEQMAMTPGEKLRKDFEDIGCKFVGKGFRV